MDAPATAAPTVPGTVTATETTVFARKTSGLVKELGAFESFAINLISLGPGPAYGLFLSILLFVPGVNLLQATVFAAIVGVPVVVAYGMMAIAMPRSGGEYVYSSRLLHPYFGTVAGLGRLFNVGLYAAVLPYWFITLSVGPSLGAWGAIVGNSALLNLGNAWSFGSPTINNFQIALVGEILTVVLMVAWIFLKPRLAFRIFAGMLIVELLGILVSVGALFAMGHSGYVNAVNSFTGNSSYYQTTAAYGAGVAGSYGSNLRNTLAFVPLVFAFYFMFATAPNYIAGEFRRTSRSVGAGMAWSYGVCIVFSVLIVLAFEQVVGGNFLNGVMASSTYFFPGAPPYLGFGPALSSLPMLAAHGNPVVIGIMFLGTAVWYPLWIILGFYIFSRYALSYSLDRMLPRGLGAVSRSSHSPYAGILAAGIIGLVLMPLLTYYYSTFYTPFVFLLFFLPMVTVSLTGLSLARLGVRERRRGYTVAGAIAFVATAVSAYLVATLPVLGSAAGFTSSNVTTGYATVLVLLLVGAAWYFGVRTLERRRSGVDIALAFKELPPD
jgi:amino acid transporter